MPATHTIKLGTKTYPNFKKDKIEAPGTSGYRSVPDGQLVAEMVLEIDILALDLLCRRAVASKRGRSVLHGGAITMRALNRKKTGAG